MPLLTRILGISAAVLSLFARGHAESELFQRISLEAEAGYVFPLGNLSPLLNPNPNLGLRATSSYYGPLLAHTRIHVGQMDGEKSPVPVLMGSCGVGLEWHGKRAFLTGIGLGLSLNYGHVSSEEVPPGRQFFMEDGESEFGFYHFLRWHIPLQRTLFLVGEIRNDVILTEPEYSKSVSTLLGVGWQWK